MTSACFPKIVSESTEFISNLQGKSCPVHLRSGQSYFYHVNDELYMFRASKYTLGLVEVEFDATHSVSKGFRV